MKLKFSLLPTFIAFLFLSSSLKAAIQVEILPEGTESGYVTYKVFVNKNKNKLANEPIIRELKIDIAELPDFIPAEKLFSRYIQKWMYQTTTVPGQNCWHTSISSLFNDWTTERRMPAKEFKCHLDNSFKRISSPSQWGDLISIVQDRKEIHGFTFLGVDSKNPKRILTLTKNGYHNGRFVFMTLDDVKDMWGNNVRYYRAIREAEDPSNNPKAVCSGFDEWEMNNFRNEKIFAEQ